MGNDNLLACPVCMEQYNMESRIPKSLECRHAICKLCLLSSGGGPMSHCPLCRDEISNPSRIPNDLSVMAHMEKKSQRKIFKQRAEKLNKLRDRGRKASEQMGKLLKECKSKGEEAVREHSDTFALYARHLFEKCLQKCSRDQSFWKDASTKNIRDLEGKMKRLQASVNTCTSLLDKGHITVSEEALTSCASEVLDAVKAAQPGGRSQTAEESMWNSYRESMIDVLSDLSQTVPSSDSSFTPGMNNDHK